MISSVKDEYAKKWLELEEKRYEIIEREFYVREMEDEYKNRVSSEVEKLAEQYRIDAEKKFKNRTVKIEKQFHEKSDSIYKFAICCLLCYLFSIMLIACKSQRCIRDFSEFAGFVWFLFSSPAHISHKFSIWIWINDSGIICQILNTFIAIPSIVIVFLLTTSLIYGGIIFFLYEAVKFYRVEYGNLSSASNALVSLGFLVLFADYFPWITCNLFFTWIVIHGIYLLIHGVRLGDNNNHRSMNYSKQKKYQIHTEEKRKFRKTKDITYRG